MASETTHERATARPLDAAELDQFTNLGYLVLPGFLPDDLVRRLRPEVDLWVDSGLRAQSIAACVDPQTTPLPPLVELELAAHGELVAYPPLMGLLGQLMGTDFVFHHLHTDRHGPDTPGKPWHHDYECGPETDRGHLMVHALSYLDGLDKDTASLAVLPGSHRTVADKKARAHQGTDPLPGELAIDELSPGSVVLLHSALFHTRRPSVGRPVKPRYLTDSSYCQVGTLWPPVKPYWRHVLAKGRALAFDRSRWPELFSERHFVEYARTT
jgi:hypothetical protein